jgi:chromosome segregation ATPase
MMSTKQTPEERAALVAELEKCEAELADLEKRRERMPFNPVTGNPELARINEQISPLRTRIEVLRDQVRHHDKVVLFRQRAVESAQETESAREAMEAAEQQVIQLEARAGTLKQRIEAIQAKNSAAEEAALTAETEAAQAYAGAVSQGNEKVEKATLAKVQEAQAETFAVRTRIASDDVVLAALEAEAQTLEEQAAAARSEAADHRQRMREARRYGLQAEWDAAARNLAAVGVELLDVGEHGLWKLHVPVFSLEGHSYLDVDDLRTFGVDDQDEASEGRESDQEAEELAEVSDE